MGNTVRRTVYPWSPSVHRLLEHLEQVGFPFAPRFLGIDGQGREVLEFIDGIAGAEGANGPGFGAHAWAMVVPDEGLARFARLVRDFHDAVASFSPPHDSSWATGTGTPQPAEVLCHNDLGPWNVVWRDGSPVGIIDWDYAGPAPPLDDVAYAIWWSLPFASDEECVVWRRFPAPPDRRHRLEVFAVAYGLDRIDGLVEAVIVRQHKFRSLVLDLAARGDPGSMEEVASGYLDTVDAWIHWSTTNRALIER